LPVIAADRQVVRPLAPARYHVQLTVSGETHDLLRRAQDLLRHEIPNGDPALVVGRALELLVRHLEQRKFAAKGSPAQMPEKTARAARSEGAGDPTDTESTECRPRAHRVRPPGRRSRYIPAAVRRAVWARDEGRCAFVGGGERCHEGGFLEFHHRIPYADGGQATVENIELRCRRHNQFEAELIFAAEPMTRSKRPGAASCPRGQLGAAP
jgi:hypothetical protein